MLLLPFYGARYSVEWWAGNGGEMAAKKQKKLEGKVETGEQSTAKKDPCFGCDLDCANCKVDGAKTLRRAACQTLKRESNNISTKLAEKAKEGDANCTKLLLMLTESQPVKEGAKKVKRGRREALALVAEPEWSEEEIEELAETGTGSREPEG